MIEKTNIYYSILKTKWKKERNDFDWQPSINTNRDKKIIFFDFPFRQNFKATNGKLFFKLVWKFSPKIAYIKKDVQFEHNKLVWKISRKIAYI